MDSKISDKVGKILKKLRTERGLTQEDLANMLNIKRQTYSAWERGIANPDIETISFLADFYNVSTDYLLGKTENPKEPDLPVEFKTPEEAMKFILEQNVIMGFGGFDINKMNDEEIIEFANELLRQLKLISYKYKK